MVSDLNFYGTITEVYRFLLSLPVGIVIDDIDESIPLSLLAHD